MKKKDTRNIRLLRRVQRAIPNHPDQFEMSWWFTERLHFKVQSRPAGGCGTAACIGGWAIHLAGLNGRVRKPLVDTGKYRRKTNSAPMARKLLRLSEADGDRLFARSSWPKPFYDRYYHATTLRQRAKAAADRIEHFIKEGE